MEVGSHHFQLPGGFLFVIHFRLVVHHLKYEMLVKDLKVLGQIKLLDTSKLLLCFCKIIPGKTAILKLYYILKKLTTT